MTNFPAHSSVVKISSLRETELQVNRSSQQTLAEGAFVLMQTSGILGLKVPQTLVCWNQALRTVGQNVSPAPQVPLHLLSLTLFPVSYQAVFHGTRGFYKLTNTSSFVPVLTSVPCGHTDVWL